MRSGHGEILRAINVRTIYEDREILRGVDVSVQRGEVFVIMGPSGCGKTTLMRHLCGLRAPTSGAVFVSGQDIFGLSPAATRALRLRMGFAFQGGALLGNLSVQENVALPLRENTDLADDLIVELARMKLDMVDMLHAADLLPAMLSGGMKKRAAIARAIALDPEIVFLDEPSAGLDPITAAGVDNVIRKLNCVFGITMVVVTHDLQSAYEIADRAVMLLQGRVAVTGSKDELWGRQEAEVRDFLDRRLPDQDNRGADIARLITL